MAAGFGPPLFFVRPAGRIFWRCKSSVLRSQRGHGSGGQRHEARIARLESDVGHLRSDVADMNTDIRSLRDRIEQLSAALKAKVDGATSSRCECRQREGHHRFGQDPGAAAVSRAGRENIRDDGARLRLALKENIRGSSELPRPAVVADVGLRLARPPRCVASTPSRHDVRVGRLGNTESPGFPGVFNLPVPLQVGAIGEPSRSRADGDRSRELVRVQARGARGAVDLTAGHRAIGVVGERASRATGVECHAGAPSSNTPSTRTRVC
jgi:hypothetical protein